VAADPMQEDYDLDFGTRRKGLRTVKIAGRGTALHGEGGGGFDEGDPGLKATMET